MSDYSIVQGTLGLPSAGLGNATSETQFTTANAQGGLASGSVLMCRIPASNTLKFRPFIVRAGGRVTTGTTATLTPKLYFGGSSTISSNSAFYAPGAGQSLATASSNWLLEAECYWDSTSLVVNGFATGFCGTTLYSLAATTQLTNIDISSTEVNLRSLANNPAASATNALVFSITGLFSSGNASNNAFVDVFEIEAF